MQVVDTLIVGAGQAGLAASRLLTEAHHEHVVLERGSVGERWLSSTWDSLRLLTPNWMSRLPHWTYTGPRPDDFMSASEVAEFLAAYGRSFEAPVQSHTTVEHVRRKAGKFEVSTDRGSWQASNLVIATGWADTPWIPPAAARLDRNIQQLAPAGYKHPGQLAVGGVLIVGASATGAQLADEMRRAGRDVYLAVGGHTRMPRRYRGRDIFFWLEHTGALDRGVDEMPSLAVARREPSLQLIGRGGRDSNVDLATLADSGVTLTGRLTSIDGTVVGFANDLHSTIARADRRLRRVLGRIDDYIDVRGMLAEVQSHTELLQVPRIYPPLSLDLRVVGVSTVIWATGHLRDYRWLHIPVFDAEGEIDHRYGITRVPGLYVLGQRFQRTRRSTFISGVGADAVTITRHLRAQRRLVA
jgi:putative flavoprotein involved in K+ transport